MVKRVTKKEYDQKERLGANGIGKDRLKVLYQNGGAKEKTIEIFERIETMLSNTRPHVFFISESFLDLESKSRLENRHNFVTESQQHSDRIWAAIRTTVPYVRRTDLETPDFANIWLEFGTGSSKYMIIGAYREFKRLGVSGSRDVSKQIIRWRRFMDSINNFVTSTNMECHLMGDLNLNKDKWPQLGCRSNNWPYVKMVDELYDKLINGAGFTLSETEGPTWISIDGSKSSTLDLHLCNDPSKVKSVTTTKEFLGDHHTLIMTRSETDVLGNQQCTKRPWSKVDYIWVYCTYAVYWQENVARELFNIQDPDEVAERITCILNTLLDAKWPVNNHCEIVGPAMV